MNIELEVGINCKVCGVPAPHVDDLWSMVFPHVQAALEHSRGELTAEDIYDCLVDRLMQLWVVYDSDDNFVASLVTQIVTYPRKKFLRVVTLGGYNMEDWKDGWAFVELWARHQGCDGVEAFARRGFVPRLKDAGFTEYYAMIGKPFLPLDVH